MRWQIVIFVVAGAAAGVGAQDDLVKKELKKLEGTWKVVDSLGPDEKVNQIMKEKAKFTFSAGKMKVTISGQDSETKFQIDPSKDPKHFDVIQEDEKKEKRVVLGIYALEDNDSRLLIRSYNDLKMRPSDFTYKAGDMGGVVVLEREKKKK